VWFRRDLRVDDHPARDAHLRARGIPLAIPPGRSRPGGARGGPGGRCESRACHRRRHSVCARDHARRRPAGARRAWGCCTAGPPSGR